MDHRPRDEPARRNRLPLDVQRVVLSGTLVTLAMSTGQWGGACAGWNSLGAPGWVLHARLSRRCFDRGHRRRCSTSAGSPSSAASAPGSTSRCRAKGSSPLPTTRSSAGAHRALAPGARPIRRPGGCTSCGPARGGSRASPNGAALQRDKGHCAASGSRAGVELADVRADGLVSRQTLGNELAARSLRVSQASHNGEFLHAVKAGALDRDQVTEL